MTSGRDFELEMLRRVKQRFASGDYGIDPSCVKFFHQKAYYSPERGSNIVVDVSVEIYRRGAKEPYLVWIWECKDYKDRVPVDDVEEFHAKLGQIGVHRTKGTIVSRKGFQKSALAFAKFHGIGLARVYPDDTLVRLTEARADLTLSQYVEQGLVQPSSYLPRTLFYAISGAGKPATWLSDLIESELDDAKQ